MLKAESPIDVIDDGRFIVGRDKHPINVNDLICVIEEGIVTCSRFTQFLKAPYPIEVTEGGTVISLIEVSAKA